MKTTLLVCCIAFLPGCEEALFAHPEHAEHAENHEHEHAARGISAADAARVLVLDAKNIDRATEALGVVDAHERPGHHEEALGELRAAAAALGAEAVIGVEFHHGEGHDEVSHLSGMAVRFRNLLRDEPYDVVATLEVPADMHHQDEAMTELRRRGREVHADLIININYEHGEGDGPVKLSGKAIRYRSSSGSFHGSRWFTELSSIPTTD